MRLPDFLIIGAQKAGTTTLFFDLVTQTAIHEPLDKEPSALTSDEILAHEGLRRYAALFRSARADQLCFEASTDYTKLPDYPGTTDRARRIFGDRISDLKVVYLVRDPVRRIISHHHHEFIDHIVTDSIDRVVREHPRFLDWTRYATQIQPWLDLLGQDRVRIIQFEQYIKNRRETVADLAGFLGFRPDLTRIDPERIENRSSGRPVLGPVTRFVAQSRLYRSLVRPMLSNNLRKAARERLLAKHEEKPAPPSRDTVQFIRDELAEEMLRIAELMGWETPPWTDQNPNEAAL